MSCRKIGLLSSTTSPQQGLVLLKYYCLCHIFSTADPFATKLGLMVDHHKLQCHVERKKGLLQSSFSFHLIYPLIARVLWAPQMISQPVSSIFPVLHSPLGLGELQACPFPNVAFPPLPLSTLSSSPFHCALQDDFGQT